MSIAATHELLAGLVERVTFHNDENGFCVLRSKARGRRDLVTLIGHAAVISAGEWVAAASEPTSLDGIENTSGRGMIRGIGPVYAKKLVRAFGETGVEIGRVACQRSHSAARVKWQGWGATIEMKMSRCWGDVGA